MNMRILNIHFYSNLYFLWIYFHKYLDIFLERYIYILDFYFYYLHIFKRLFYASTLFEVYIKEIYLCIFRAQYAASWTTMTQVEIRDVTSGRQYLRICIKLMVQGRCGNFIRVAL